MKSDKLIASLNVCASREGSCAGCAYSKEDPNEPSYVRFCGIIEEAANTIKNLQDELRNCRDELCLKCGSYKESHLGACDGCRYKDMECI